MSFFKDTLAEDFGNLESFTIEEKDFLNFLWRIKYFSYEFPNLHEKTKENASKIAVALCDYIKNV